MNRQYELYLSAQRGADNMNRWELLRKYRKPCPGIYENEPCTEERTIGRPCDLCGYDPKKGKQPGIQCWRTPKQLFAYLHSMFRFTVDACANDINHLLPRYWTQDDNAKLQDWSKERVFCDPPFKNPAGFLRKAKRAALALVVLRLDALTNAYVNKYRPDYLILPKNRIQFYLLEEGDGGDIDFGSCLLLYCKKPCPKLKPEFHVLKRVS